MDLIDWRVVWRHSPNRLLSTSSTCLTSNSRKWLAPQSRTKSPLAMTLDGTKWTWEYIPFFKLYTLIHVFATTWRLFHLLFWLSPACGNSPLMHINSIARSFTCMKQLTVRRQSLRGRHTTDEGVVVAWDMSERLCVSPSPFCALIIAATCQGIHACLWNGFSVKSEVALIWFRIIIT